MAKDAKKKAQQPEVLSENTRAMFDALNDESPLIAAIHSGAMVEQALMSLMAKFMITGDTAKGMFDDGRPLGTMAGCARMAYCLGLISATLYNNAIKIGEIRNIFAHSHVPVTFQDPAVVKKCGELSLPRAVEGEGFFGQLAKDPRGRFSQAAIITAYSLIMAAMATERRPEHSPEW